jgi:hypothetical protein
MIHHIVAMVRVRGGSTNDGKIAWNWTENTMEQLMDENQQSEEPALFRNRSASGAERNFHSSDSISDMHKGITTSRSLLTFNFDHVYSPSSLSADIFDTSLKDLVVSSCQGFNGTIFAYGPTGSGKTHSIVGSNDDPGLFPLTLMEIFKYIAENRSEQFLLQVSYYEIDNDEIKDLLGDDEDKEEGKEGKTKPVEKLKVVDRPDVGPLILGLTLVPVSKPEDAVEQLLRGNRKRKRLESGRKLGPHPATHAVLQLRIESTPSGGNGGNSQQLNTRVAQLNLIDLAGSEKMQVPGSSGAPKLNASLLTLGNVIAKLSERASHIPYRESTLTRLLSTSLGGNARTAILCTVCPGQHELPNTLNTLRFGARAMSVVNNVRKNSVRSARSEMERFKKQIGTLRTQLSEARVGTHALATEEENTLLKIRLKEMENLLLDSNSEASREVKQMVDTEDASMEEEAVVEKKKKRPTYRRKSIVFSAEAVKKATEGILDEKQEQENDVSELKSRTNKKRAGRGRRRLSMAMGSAMTRMSIDSAASMSPTLEEEESVQDVTSKVWQYTKEDTQAPPLPPPLSSSTATTTQTALPSSSSVFLNQYDQHNQNTLTSISAPTPTRTPTPRRMSFEMREAMRMDTSAIVLPNDGGGGSPAAVNMLRTEMAAQMKTILKLQDKLALVDEQVFAEQRTNYELTDQLRKEKLAKIATESTCEQLQDMLKSVRGHFEDSEEKTMSRTDRVQNLLTETRKTVEERDVEIMELKESLKIEIAKRGVIVEAEKNAKVQHDLANYYFDKLVHMTNARESMERTLMASEELRARDIRIVLNQSDTWHAMERRVRVLEIELTERNNELSQVRKEANTSRRDVVSLESALVEARLIAGRMEAFSAHLASEMESETRSGNGSSTYGIEHRSTPTTKLLKSLAEKSQSRVIRLTRTPVNMYDPSLSNDDGGRFTNNGNGSGSGSGGTGSLTNQASLVRELTEKLRDSEFRVAGLELARELDAQQRARLETMMADLETGMRGLQLDRRSAWSATQHKQTLASLALRELDSLRRELSAIGSRDSNRMEQIKQIEYVNGGLNAMGADDDRSVQNMRKDIQFFKPLLREELAYTVDELVLLNERLHVSCHLLSIYY